VQIMCTCTAAGYPNITQNNPYIHYSTFDGC
jgi:hypothetical protein